MMENNTNSSYMNLIQKEFSLIENIYKGNTINNVLNSIPLKFLILNEYREIVYANDLTKNLFKIKNDKILLGKTLGELLDCVNYKGEESSCGNSNKCKFCGFLITINNSIRTEEKSFGEAKIFTLSEKKPIKVKISTNFLLINEKKYILAILEDVEDKKTNDGIEQIFFHDVMNTLQMLVSSIAILKNQGDPTETKNVVLNIERTTNNLVNEIQYQQLLYLSDKKELKVNPSPIDVKELVDEVVEQFKNTDKSIVVERSTEEMIIKSDKVLLRRILVNALKNSIEAGGKEETVKVRITYRDNETVFSIFNPGYIPETNQTRIFEKHFSTKGTNRGLGTYSMKLLSSYLHGQVDFTSTEKEGTTFNIKIPTEL